MKRTLLLVGWLVFSSSTLSEESSRLFSSQSWPAADSSCESCIPVQFDQLSLQVPKGKLLGVHVLHMNMPAASLSYQGGSPDGTVKISLLLMDERKATGGLREAGFFERLSVATLHQFFVSLARPSADKQALELSQEILGLNEASEYLTISGDAASAFWVKTRDVNNQRLYIVEKDSRYAYQIAGPLTQDIVSDLLSYAHFD